MASEQEAGGETEILWFTGRGVVIPAISSNKEKNHKDENEGK